MNLHVSYPQALVAGTLTGWTSESWKARSEDIVTRDEQSGEALSQGLKLPLNIKIKCGAVGLSAALLKMEAAYGCLIFSVASPSVRITSVTLDKTNPASKEVEWTGCAINIGYACTILQMVFRGQLVRFKLSH